MAQEMFRKLFKRAWLLVAVLPIFFAASMSMGEPAIPPTSGSDNSSSEQPWQDLRNEMINIKYVPPDNPDNRETYELLKKRKVLEELSAFLSPIELLTPLSLTAEECKAINLYYSPLTGVHLCYEMPKYIARVAPSIKLPKGLTTDDVIIGVFVQMVLHEVGHALFHHLFFPILGREEDAADQIAAFVMLNFGKDFARRTLAGSAQFYQAIDASMQRNVFSDEHGTVAQRYYNLLCIAYGGQPEAFEDLVTAGTLPKERAAGCAREYDQVKHAFSLTVLPYVNKERLVKVQSIEWAQPGEKSYVGYNLRLCLRYLPSIALAVAFIVVVIIFVGPDYKKKKGVERVSSEPVRNWTKVPLFAFIIFSVGPTIVGYALCVSHGLFNYRPMAIVIVPEEPLLDMAKVALANCWYLLLYGYTKWRANKEAPKLGSVKLAMWLSVIAMALPNFLFVLLSAGTTLAGIGTYLGEIEVLMPYFPLLVGIGSFALGLVAWLVGRIIWFVGRLVFDLP